jgi:NAD+ diphosphatase
MHHTQPWPHPANLMIGAIGQAIAGEGEQIHLGHDAELKDARWFPVEEVGEALRIGTSGLGDPPGLDYEGGLRVPPRTAIAHQLMHAVVNTGFRNGGSTEI